MQIDDIKIQRWQKWLFHGRYFPPKNFALAGLLCGCDKSASCGKGRRHDNCLPDILRGLDESKLFWMVDETTSDAHVRGGPPYPSHKVYPAYQVQLLSQPPKSIFRTIHTSYFQTHTLLNRCLCLQLLVGFSLFFCNWHTPYHTMMGTDLLLVIQIYRIPEKLLSNRKQLEWLNRPIFLAFVIAQLI